MVGEQVVDRAAFLHSDTRIPGIVVFDHGAGRTGPFQVVHNVNRGYPAHGRLDAIAIAVVHEGCRGRATDPGQVILGT